MSRHDSGVRLLVSANRDDWVGVTHLLCSVSSSSEPCALSASGFKSQQADRPATAACDLWSIPFSITSSDSIQSEACASPKLLGFIDNLSKAALQTSRHAIFSRLSCRLRPFCPPFGQFFHFFPAFACHCLFPSHSTAPTACLSNHPPLQPTSNRPSHRIASLTQPLRIS